MLACDMRPTAPAPTSTADTRRAIADAVRKYWGYDQLRPLQVDAIEAELAHQDSLVVLPTGGGKSLCYQVPPVVAGRTDIVVSPLIALMKDQVDALKANGYAAAALHSGMSDAERRTVEAGLARGDYRLVFVAPERLLTPTFLGLAARAHVSSFAIDEAHCISHWGHDFRPEYRRIAELRRLFPNAALHAYTATATERVRADIIAQLGLQQPRVLVGEFDRPNLVYRVVRRTNAEEQALGVIQRHRGEAVIVYCISRADTERTAAVLRAKGVQAAAYHAGMEPAARARTQEDFAAERLDVVVATVAFGMGIDRSNVRCVIHAALPKSVEQYQQETGRAGRDGLEAECVLLFAPGDAQRWEQLMRKSAAETAQPRAVTDAQLELLRDMQRFGETQECRHQLLARYFDQPYERANCGACDTCLEPPEAVENGTGVAQQVLSCVRGLRVGFGVVHVVDVLTGARTARLHEFHHDQLPEYGALKAMPKEVVRSLVLQLVEQGLLERTGGERPVLRLRRAALEVLAGDRTVALVLPDVGPLKAAGPAGGGWEGVDRGLFEELRVLRRAIAEERSMPPFVVFSDATLRDLARVRPVSLAGFGQVRGIGERKQADLGPRFTAAIAAYAGKHGLSTDVQVTAAPVSRPAAPRPSSRPNPDRERAFQLFERGCTVAEATRQTGRAPSTVEGYLEAFIVERAPASLDPWVDEVTYARVKATAEAIGGGYLRPVWEALGGTIGYDVIRAVQAHAGLRGQPAPASS